MSEIEGSDVVAPETLEALFLACEGPLLRYAHKLVQDPDACQEIVQESFMKLHAQFSTVRQPRPWLYRTVHNLAVNQLRARKKIVPLDFDGDGAEPQAPVDGQPRPDESMVRTETINQTRRCLEGLDERGRELIRLKFDEGLSYEQMSQRTGLSVGNVGYILHHALKQLASDLEDSGVTL